MTKLATFQPDVRAGNGADEGVGAGFATTGIITIITISRRWGANG